jgi:hypothetical protein
MDAKEAPPGTVFPKGINPFICDRCGKPSDGGCQVQFSAAYGSDYDSCGVCTREVCDACFRGMVPLFKDRIWLSDAKDNLKYEEMDQVIKEIKEYKISQGLLPLEEW